MPIVYPRGFTRRKRNNPIENPSYNVLHHLGSGSYGAVYEIPGTHMALKEHRISNLDSQNNMFYENWNHEFEMQQSIFTSCNNILNSLHVNIVKPYIFSYGKRTAGNILMPQSNVQNASSCFFTMEHVPGLAFSSHCSTRKLYTLLQSDRHLQPSYIPPYMYLGSLIPLNGHITLDMLQGTQLLEFPNDAFNYCLVDGIALYIMSAMVLSFLTILEKGFVPRDIEFVFNSSCNNIYCSILDFNEVKTIEERSNRPGYTLEIDIAHVYIDLCGLRSSRDVNPEAPYDSPTPQWKFLCSPIVSPYAFFACFDSAKNRGFKTFDVDKIVNEILEYVERRSFKPIFNRMSHAFSLWKPVKSEFSDKYIEFDSKLQMYYFCGLMETIEKRKLTLPNKSLDAMEYKEILNFLQSLLTLPNHTIDDDWEFPLSFVESATMHSIKPDNNTMKIRPRRYTVRKL